MLKANLSTQPPSLSAFVVISKTQFLKSHAEQLNTKVCRSNKSAIFLILLCSREVQYWQFIHIYFLRF